VKGVDISMFISGKDRHALELASAYFYGVGMGCLLIWSGWVRYVSASAFVVAFGLSIAALVARRRAQVVQ
jgi:hypothetical protein